MAIQDYKVSEAYSGRDIASLSDRPNQDGMTAAQLKARFDQLNKEVIPNYNDLIDLLKALLEDGSVTNGHTHNVDNLVDGIVNRLFTEVLKLKLDGIEEGAEVNQNAFSSIKVGSNTANASLKTDTFEIIPGLNIVALLNPTTKQITLSATGDISTLAVQSLIEDIGEYFTSLNVEGALQEIGLALSNIYTKTESDTLLFDKVDKIEGKGLSTNDYDNTEKASVLNSKTLLENITSSTKEPTGFTNNENIDVSYNSTTRKVTLTGTFKAYFKGVEVTALVSGWESPAHADVTGNYYLYYNGTSFVFDTTAWTFDMLMIAFIQYNSHRIGVREVHGFMPWQAHKEFHDTIGAYRCDGGDFSNYTLNSTTATNRRPYISVTSVCDEDLKSNLPALTTNSYTQRYLTGSGSRTFNINQSEIIANNGSVPYWNQFTGGNWVQTLMGNNDYGAIFVVAVPMTSDATSQLYRYMFVQPQQVSTDLAVIQALSPSNLTHGDSSNLLSEFVFIGKIIVKASVTNWVIWSVEKLEGTRISQVATSGNFLSVVTTDSTLSGNGTVGSPLGVQQTLPINQIKFPATQVPSSDPNTLDDYEEGTWTPVNAQNSGQIGTWSTYVGRYTKIGKVVVVTIEITGTGMGYNSTTGYTKFTGLPFTPQGGAGGTWVSGNIAGGLCGMSLAINTDNALWLASPQVANVTSTVIWGSAMYLVA